MTSDIGSEQLGSLPERERAAAEGRRRANGTPGGLHTPVSNAAASEEVGSSSAPAYGAKGKPRGRTLEVAWAPKAGARAAPSGEPTAEAVRLDACWGSFADADTRALLRSGKTPDGKPLQGVVFGTDDRIEIGNTQTYPWRCIASLRIEAGSGTQWIGTGWLVGPRILLTAGHCVYMSDEGGWVRSIEVIPGRQGGQSPYGSCIATSFRSTQGWVQNAAIEYDYAAILLPESCRFGDQLGWFGYEVWNDDNLADLMVNISGYPSDKPDGTQWWHSNTLTGVAEQLLTYEVDTVGGQSGAPVWIRKPDGARYGLGIHTNGAVTGNLATRITLDVYNNITSWRAEVP